MFYNINSTMIFNLNLCSKSINMTKKHNKNKPQNKLKTETKQSTSSQFLKTNKGFNIPRFFRKRDKTRTGIAYRNRYQYLKIVNVFLLLFVFLSFIVLAIYAPRVIHGKSLGFDYMGVIVTVLSILVTTLIGWNIYNVISIKNEIESFKDNIRHENVTIQAHFHKSVMDSDGRIALLDTNGDGRVPYLWYQYLNSTLKALYYLHKAKLHIEIKESEHDFDSIWGEIDAQGVPVDKKVYAEILTNLNSLRGLVEDELYNKFDSIITNDIKIS